MIVIYFKNIRYIFWKFKRDVLWNLVGWNNEVKVFFKELNLILRFILKFNFVVDYLL